MKSLCCDCEFDVKNISIDSLGYSTTCPICKGSFDVDMKIISFPEAMTLKEGDEVFVRIGNELVKSEVVRRAFWNSDADEPDWEVETTNGFCDIYSLYKLNNEIEKGNDNMNNEKIKIEVTGGNLIVKRNSDPDFDGVSIFFETEKGDLCDIALVECKASNNYNKIDVYTYENVHDDDWTRKFTLDNDEINKAFE